MYSLCLFCFRKQYFAFWFWNSRLLFTTEKWLPSFVTPSFCWFWLRTPSILFSKWEHYILISIFTNWLYLDVKLNYKNNSESFFLWSKNACDREYRFWRTLTDFGCLVCRNCWYQSCRLDTKDKIRHLTTNNKPVLI